MVSCVIHPETERYLALCHATKNSKDVSCENVWICRVIRGLTKPQYIPYTQSLPSVRERWLVRINQEAACCEVRNAPVATQSEAWCMVSSALLLDSEAES